MGSPGQMTPRDAAAASDALVRLYASVTVGKAVGFRVTRQGNRFGTFKDEREAALESDCVARILDPEGEKLRLNFPVTHRKLMSTLRFVRKSQNACTHSLRKV